MTTGWAQSLQQVLFKHQGGLSAALSENVLWPGALADTVVSAPRSEFLARVKSTKRPFRVTAAARTLTEDELSRMSESRIRQIFHQLRWPETGGKPVCPRCACRRSYYLKTRRLFKCADCGRQFTVTSGTVWERHKVQLRQIAKLIFHFAIAPKGASAAHLSLQMGLDVKTVFNLLGKIREALYRRQCTLTLHGAIEIDGIYFSYSRRRPNIGRRAIPELRATPRNRCALTLSERDGPTIALAVEGETRTAILAAVRKHVALGSSLYTDELPSYRFLRAYFHLKQINHSIHYADGLVSTNNAESFHARARRAQRGVYHRFANGNDFDLYLAELAYRHSCRDMDTKAAWAELIRITLQHPPSERFRGYWQRRKRTDVELDERPLPQT